MKPWLFSLLSCIIFWSSTQNADAAGIIYRIQYMKAMKQKQMQQYQQQQMGGGPTVPGQQQAVSTQQSYQQMVDQRNQAIAQAILKAHSDAVTTENWPTNLNVTPSPAVAEASNEGQDVDLSEVWKKLDTSSRVWTLLVEDQAKVLTVSEYLDRFRRQGVKINEPPEHYVQMIDQMSQTTPQMLERPFGDLLKILAIIDYDFDNGMDKDELARKVLGDAAYEQNKQRFQQAQQSQQGP